MTREADVVRALVTLADTLVGDYDVCMIAVTRGCAWGL